MNTNSEIMKDKELNKACSSFTFSVEEVEYLRRLAERVADHARSSEMRRKAILWQRHNDLETDEPIIHMNLEGGWYEILPDSDLVCKDPLARKWERDLKYLIYHAEVLKDDKAFDLHFDVPYSFRDTGWGVDIVHIGGENKGAYAIKQAITDFEEDFEKIHFPEFVIDWEESDKILELAKEVFGDILIVRRWTSWWWSLGLSQHYAQLRGLEEFMCDFLLEPEWTERMYDFLCRGTLNMIDYLENNNLLSQNIGPSYSGSGGYGFTNQISQKREGEKILTSDMWGFCESQETVSVSPDMYGEFVYPHYRKIMERFGLNCYACCEPYDQVWKYVKNIPRLRRISVSPWAKWNSVPENLGKNYVACVKLLPTPLAQPILDEENVRSDCRRAAEETKGGICEFIMQDTHTFGNNPRNASRWVEIMREEVERVYR